MNIGDIRALEDEQDPERRRALLERLADAMSADELFAHLIDRLGGATDAVQMRCLDYEAKRDRPRWTKIDGEFFCVECLNEIGDEDEVSPMYVSYVEVAVPCLRHVGGSEFLIGGDDFVEAPYVTLGCSHCGIRATVESEEM